MANQLERRAAVRTVEVRAEGEGSLYIEGLATPYKKLSQDLGGFREMFLGAPRGLSSLEIPAFWNHNSDIVLGRSPKTMSLTDSDDGLGYRINPPKWAGGYVETIERGDVKGTSWGFRVFPDGERWVVTDDGAVIREVFDWELVEISPTPSPAYLQTDAGVAMRSFEAWRKTDAAQPVQRLIRERMHELQARCF